MEKMLRPLAVIMGRFKSIRLKELLSYDIARPGYMRGMFPARLM